MEMERDILEIRPKLKHDAVFLELENGTFFQGNNKGFVLKGRSVYKWISALTPYMTGEYTLAQLCDGLEPTQANMIINLVQALLEKDVIRNHIPEDSGLLPEALATYFQRQIELIAHYADSPFTRFQKFREGNLLLVGNGHSLTALAKTLIRNGLRTVQLMSDDNKAVYREALQPEMEALQEQQIETSLVFIEADAPLHEYDLVVFAADATSLKDIYQWQQKCLEAHCPFLPVTPFNELVIIGPLVTDKEGPCWLSAMMRLTANMAESDYKAALWKDMMLGQRLNVSQTPYHSVVAGLVGNGVAFEVFKLLAGHIQPETLNSVIIQRVDTLETRYSRLLPHPLSPLAEPTPDRNRQRLLDFVRDNTEELPEVDNLFDRYYFLVDPFVGIIHSFADEDIEQIPLKVARIELGDPHFTATEKHQITAFSIQNLKEARDIALLASLEYYARSLPDTRGMKFASRAEMADQGLTVITEEQLASHTGVPIPADHTRVHWLPAYALFAEDICYVPAASVYTNTYLNRFRHFDDDSAGWSVGSSLSDLLEKGILHQLAGAQARSLIAQQSHLAQIPQESWRHLDESIDYLLTTLERFNETVSLAVIQSEAPVFTVIARTSQNAMVASAYALTLVEAIRKALISVIGNLQLLDSGAIRSLPKPDRLTELLSAATPTGVAQGLLEATHSQEEILAYLRAKRQEVLFVLATPKDLDVIGGLHVGTILLTHAPHRMA